MSVWKIFAVGPALFAGTTAVLAKIGVKNVLSNLATFIKTIVIIIFLGVIIHARPENRTLQGAPACRTGRDEQWPLSIPLLACLR